jgi:hypothetical protein
MQRQQTIIVQEQPRGPSILVEVPIANAATTTPFPDVQQLRSQPNQVIVIKKIRLITDKVLSNGITNAAANMPLVDQQNSAVVIYAEGWEKGKYIPNLLLNDMNDSDATAATTIPFKNTPPSFDNWLNVDWAQSRIQFANGQTASQAGVFIYEVEYIKLRADKFLNGVWEEIQGPS